MTESLTLTGPLLEQSAVCDAVLRALPNWFGIEEAIQHYTAEVAALPTWLARAGDEAVGFLSIKQHSSAAAEIYVMGILTAYHRQGLGRRLVAAAEDRLRAAGVTFLQVKTLSPAHPDPFYARTRQFYQSVGFQPLEEFPTLWGEANPCLLLIKYLG